MKYEKSPYRLLIAEDDTTTLGLLKNALSPLFEEVYGAEDGKSAWELFSLHRPEVLLTDLVMPHLSGFELLHLVRAEAPKTITLVLTAHEEMSESIPDVDRILIKPITPNELINTLVPLLGQYDDPARHSDFGYVLFVGDNIALHEKVAHALRGMIQELLLAQDTPSLLGQLIHHPISHIYLDTDTPKPAHLTLIDTIRQNPRSSHTPITILTDAALEQERAHFLIHGAHDVIRKPFFASELRNRFLRIMAQEGQFANTLTARTIEALVRFLRCEGAAHRMESSAKLFARARGLEPQKTQDIARCARFLSLCIANKSTPQEGLALLDQLQAALPIRHILSGDPEHSFGTAVVMAIYDMECLSSSIPTSRSYGKNASVQQEIAALYAKEALIAESLDDLGLCLAHIKGWLAARPIPQGDALGAYGVVEEIVRHGLLFHQGVFIHFDHTDSEHTIKIFPWDKRILRRCVEELALNDPLINTPSFHLRTQGGGTPFYELAFPRQIPLTTPPLLVTALEEEPPQSDAQSATAFALTSPVSQDEIQTFTELEEDLRELLESSAYRHDRSAILKQAALFLKRYAHSLMYISEFDAISTTLLGLGSIAESEALGEMDEGRAKIALTLLRSITENLTEWRDRIFISKTAEDIHYLDKSIVADCEQLLQTILPSDAHDASDDAGGLELF